MSSVDLVAETGKTPKQTVYKLIDNYERFGLLRKSGKRGHTQVEITELGRQVAMDYWCEVDQINSMLKEKFLSHLIIKRTAV